MKPFFTAKELENYIKEKGLDDLWETGLAEDIIAWANAKLEREGTVVQSGDGGYLWCAEDYWENGDTHPKALLINPEPIE